MKQALTAEQLMEWMSQNLVHFSFKTINSQSAPGGIRLATDQALDLPYVSVRTLMQEGHDIGLDYLSDAKKNGGPFSQYKVANGEAPAEAATKTQEAIYQPDEAIQQCHQRLATQPLEMGTRRVGPRLRQLLIPHPEVAGGYVALSPLGSSGLCEHVYDTIRRRRNVIKAWYDLSPEERKDLARPGRLEWVEQFSVGGSNPQNVGGRIRAMTHPWVVDNAPKTNPEQRQAWRLYFKGFEPRLNYRLVKNYSSWFQDYRHATWTLQDQEKERAVLAPLLEDLAHRASAAGRLYADYAADFDGAWGPGVDEELNRGWLLGQRDVAWQDRFHGWLARALRDFVLDHSAEGDAVRIGLSEEDERRLMNQFKLIGGV